MSRAPILDRGVTRRGFLQGIAGILAAGVAPAAIGSGILMPVKTLWVPPAYAIPGSLAYFNNRLWIITNNSLVDCTVDGMQCGDSYTPTPRPIVLSPGHSMVYDDGIKVFGTIQPSTPAEFNSFGVRI